MPIMIVLVIGTIELGRAVWLYNQVAQGAAAGTRFAAVRGGSFGNPLGNATPDDVSAYVKALPGLDSVSTTVSTTWTPDRQPGSTVTVRVDTQFASSLKFPTQLNFTLHSTSIMAISY
jgi:Flp pilus assembly protein TadG